SRLLNNCHRFHAWHFLRSAGVNAADTRVCVWAAKDFAGEQAVGVVVIGVFRTTGDLHRPINSRDALAQQRASRGIGPLIIAHEALLSALASATARIPS